LRNLTSTAERQIIVLIGLTANKTKHQTLKWGLRKCAIFEFHGQTKARTKTYLTHSLT